MPRADKTKRADRRYGAGVHTAKAQRTVRSAALLRRVEVSRERRDRLVAALDALSSSDADRRGIRAMVTAAQATLDVAVASALLDRQGPADADVAAVAHMSAYEMHHAKERLSGPR